jgi:hypothetical protein
MDGEAATILTGLLLACGPAAQESDDIGRDIDAAIAKLGSEEDDATAREALASLGRPALERLLRAIDNVSAARREELEAGKNGVGRSRRLSALVRALGSMRGDADRVLAWLTEGGRFFDPNAMVEQAHAIVALAPYSTYEEDWFMCLGGITAVLLERLPAQGLAVWSAPDSARKRCRLRVRDPIDRLMAGLDDADPDIRALAIELLGERAAEAGPARGRFVRLLTERRGDWMKRAPRIAPFHMRILSAAARALVRMDESDTAEPAHAFLLLHGEIPERCRAARALGNLQKSESVPALALGLADPSFTTLRAVLTEARRFEADERFAGPALAELQAHPDREIVELARMLLEKHSRRR